MLLQSQSQSQSQSQDQLQQELPAVLATKPKSDESRDAHRAAQEGVSVRTASPEQPVLRPSALQPVSSVPTEAGKQMLFRMSRPSSAEAPDCLEAPLVMADPNSTVVSAFGVPASKSAESRNPAVTATMRPSTIQLSPLEAIPGVAATQQALAPLDLLPRRRNMNVARTADSNPAPMRSLVPDHLAAPADDDVESFELEQGIKTGRNSLVELMEEGSALAQSICDSDAVHSILPSDEPATHTTTQACSATGAPADENPASGAAITPARRPLPPSPCHGTLESGILGDVEKNATSDCFQAASPSNDMMIADLFAGIEDAASSDEE